MEKQTKTTYLLFGLALISFFIHNILTSFIFKDGEPVFFALFLILGLGFVISIVRNLITYSQNGEPKDLWKIGWLGFLGILGFLGGLRLFLFFLFFGFFLLKKQSRPGRRF